MTDQLPISKKYADKANELFVQHKTGFECVYCGANAIHVVKTDRLGLHGRYCQLCDKQQPPVLGTCYGLPIYDKEDYEALKKELREFYERTHQILKGVLPWLKK